MTNDEYLKAINLRHSRRKFKNVPPDSDSAAAIKELAAYCEGRDGVSFIVLEDGKKYLTSQSGSPLVIAVCGDDTASSRVSCGYYLESIVLQCVFHGLSTCIITSFKEEKLFGSGKIPKGKKLMCLLAVGYCDGKLSKKERIIYNISHRENKPYQKMMNICDDKLPDEYAFAMLQVEKAPSEVNDRPVKFNWQNGVLESFVDEPFSNQGLSLGIAQLHFQIGAAAKGVHGKFRHNVFVTDENKKEE